MSDHWKKQRDAWQRGEAARVNGASRWYAAEIRPETLRLDVGRATEGVIVRTGDTWCVVREGSGRDGSGWLALPVPIRRDFHEEPDFLRIAAEHTLTVTVRRRGDAWSHLIGNLEIHEIDPGTGKMSRISGDLLQPFSWMSLGRTGRLVDDAQLPAAIAAWRALREEAERAAATRMNWPKGWNQTVQFRKNLPRDNGDAPRIDGLTADQCVARWGYNRLVSEGKIDAQWHATLLHELERDLGSSIDGRGVIPMTPAQIAVAKERFAIAVSPLHAAVLGDRIARGDASRSREISVVNEVDVDDLD